MSSSARAALGGCESFRRFTLPKQSGQSSTASACPRERRRSRPQLENQNKWAVTGAIARLGLPSGCTTSGALGDVGDLCPPHRNAFGVGLGHKRSWKRRWSGRSRLNASISEAGSRPRQTRGESKRLLFRLSAGNGAFRVI